MEKFKHFKIFIFLNVYYLYVGMSVYVPKEVREVGSLKLVADSHDLPDAVLGIELGSSAGTTCAPHR